MPAPSVSRREFGLSLAAFPALAAAAPLTEKPPQRDEQQKQAAQTPTAETAKPANQPAPVPEQPEGREEVPEAAWLLGLILKRYPDERINEAAIRGIVGDIQGDQQRSKTLSDFPLENSDEPGLVFRPFVGE